MAASGMASERLEVMVVPGTPRAVGAVRRCFRDLLGPGHPALDDVLLCQSEIMTNALRHTKSGVDGHIRIEARISARGIRIEVTDDGGAESEPGVVPARDESGRGLILVSETADDWGYEHRDGTTTVWFAITFLPAD
ncbi:ATP-binding protein [Actinomadura scrupuli]|uniref:ATP-binding protein n=1 Tax=Actinomadura scrupuli TaxID=559629 RepID=UPI003D9955CD